MAKVLVCGVYMADLENIAADEITTLSEDRKNKVTQRWIALNVSGKGRCDLAGTVKTISQETPKFTLINTLLDDISDFDFLIVIDDDVELPNKFLNQFIGLINRYQFALAQPARTPDSYIDHFITMSMPGLQARLTRFVEIGPVFCIHRS